MAVLVKYKLMDAAAGSVFGEVIVFVDFANKRAMYGTGIAVDPAVAAAIFNDVADQQEAMSPEIPEELIQKVMTTKSQVGVKPLWKRVE
jgi:hypothetical protein